MTLASDELRRPQPRFSIEGRIVAAAVATAVAVLAVASAAFFFQQWRESGEGYARQQKLALRTALSVVGHPTTPRQARTVLDAMAEVPGLSYGRVEAADHSLLAERRYSAAQATSKPTVLPFTTGGRVVIAGAGDGLAEMAPTFIAVCAALFFIATGLALFLGRALARKVIQPLDALSAFMREVTGQGGAVQRAPPSALYEISRLTDSFNDLLTRLQANDAALRRSVDELVVARDAAEAANVMKSQFLANMSHEIRTPLNGVLAMTEVIALGELDSVQRDRLRVVRESGEALLSVLNDVLDVSKIEAGRLELEDADFDAADAVRSACDVFAAALQEKGLAFRLTVAPEARGWRRGDGVRLRQIVVNLLSNAVKFTPAGEVRVSVTGLGADGADGLAIEVADTGVGFPQDQLPLLLEKFTQADSSVTRRFGGTGLGLAICRDLVALMGGEITVESLPGEGSTFRIEAPLALVSRPAEAAPAQAYQPPAAAPLADAHAEPAPGSGAEVAESAGRPMRVLAAEDNPTNQLVLSTIMGVFGLDLEMVGDGRRAVEAWRAGDFDLILMDVQMPEMDGMAATRAIRAIERDEGLARTPIIALSANAMTHQVRDYVAAGMDDHVPKPIELARLQAALDRATQGQSAAEAA